MQGSAGGVHCTTSRLCRRSHHQSSARRCSSRLNKAEGSKVETCMPPGPALETLATRQAGSLWSARRTGFASSLLQGRSHLRPGLAAISTEVHSGRVKARLTRWLRDAHALQSGCTDTDGGRLEPFGGTLSGRGQSSRRAGWQLPRVGRCRVVPGVAGRERSRCIRSKRRRFPAPRRQSRAPGPRCRSPAPGSAAILRSRAEGRAATRRLWLAAAEAEYVTKSCSRPPKNLVV